MGMMPWHHPHFSDGNMKKNIKICLKKENDILSVDVFVLQVPIFIRLSFTPCNIFSVRIKHTDEKTFEVLDSDITFKLKQKYRNRLISFFSNDDVFNAIPNNIQLTTFLDSPSESIDDYVKEINRYNNVICHIPMSLPLACKWMFFDVDRNVYHLKITKRFMQDRLVVFEKKDNCRYVKMSLSTSSAGEYKEVSVDDANMQSLWEDIKSTSQPYFVKINDHIGANITNLSLHPETFTLSGPSFSITLPIRYFNVYVTNNVFFIHNDKHIFYQLKYV